MRESEPQPPGHVGALLVHGSTVGRETLEMLSIQLELFLDELDRSLFQAASERFNWQTLLPSDHESRILVVPEFIPQGAAAASAARVLHHARMGIAMITSGPRRPPMFTQPALEHLQWIARVIEEHGVTRLRFHVGGTHVDITRSTITHLGALLKV